MADEDESRKAGDDGTSSTFMDHMQEMETSGPGGFGPVGLVGVARVNNLVGVVQVRPFPANTIPGYIAKRRWWLVPIGD